MAAEAIEITKDMRKALRKVQRTQDAFWDALSTLESELGFDVTGATDFSGATIEDLIDANDEDEDEEETR